MADDEEENEEEGGGAAAARALGAVSLKRRASDDAHVETGKRPAPAAGEAEAAGGEEGAPGAGGESAAPEAAAEPAPQLHPDPASADAALPPSQPQPEVPDDDGTVRLLVPARRVPALASLLVSFAPALAPARGRLLDPLPNGGDEHVLVIGAGAGVQPDVGSLAQAAAASILLHALSDNAAAAPANEHHSLRLLVPGEHAGRLIGRKGEAIKAVRDASGASSVNILKEEATPTGIMAAGQRVMEVVGARPAVAAALRLLVVAIRDARSLSSAPRPQNNGAAGSPAAPHASHALQSSPPGAPAGPVVAGYSAHLAVPNAAVGSIIGKAGANIAQIRRLSGARVKVHEAMPGSSDRMVEMIGSHEQVAQAQVLVQGFMMAAGAAAGGAGAHRAAVGGMHAPVQHQMMAPQMGMGMPMMGGMMPMMMPGHMPMMGGMPGMQMHSASGGMPSAAQMHHMQQLQLQMQMQMAAAAAAAGGQPGHAMQHQMYGAGGMGQWPGHDGMHHPPG